MPLGSFGNNGQSRNLAQQATGRPINQAHEEEQEHGAVQAHHQVQPQPIPGVEAPLQQIGENQQHIEHNRLHGVEPDVAAEVGVPHHHEVERQEHQEPVQREALEHPDGRDEGLDEDLKRGELVDDVLAVLDAVEERVEVADGGDQPVGRVGGVAVLGPGGDGPPWPRRGEGGGGGRRVPEMGGGEERRGEREGIAGRRQWREEMGDGHGWIFGRILDFLSRRNFLRSAKTIGGVFSGFWYFCLFIYLL